MVWIKGRYSSNHPKDKAARARQKIGNWAKENYCTQRELDNPTERNIQKCMHEIQSTRQKGEEFKKASKFLGEDTNISKYRRRK